MAKVDIFFICLSLFFCALSVVVSPGKKELNSVDINVVLEANKKMGKSMALLASALSFICCVILKNIF